MSASPDEARMLRDAERAFEVGDHATVRAATRALAASKDPKVVDAAAALARKVAVDPVQIAFLAGCLAVLAAIFYQYVLR